MCFLVNIAKFLRTPILKNIYKLLLLDNFEQNLLDDCFQENAL